MKGLQINREEFLRDFWQKKPCLIKNGFSDLTPLLSPDELAGLSCEEDAESRLIKKGPALDDWQMAHGPFDETTFTELPEDNWTLLVQGVEQWLPEADQLLKEFAFLPNWRIDDLMVSYASPGGSVGPHIDHYDVFLIQGLGERDWHISDHPVEHEEILEGLDLKILKNFTGDKTYKLQTGDILYLPPKFAHHGISSRESMTLSVGFRAPHRAELLHQYGRFLSMSGDQEIHRSDKDRSEADHPGLLGEQDRHSFRCLLKDAFLDENFDRWLAVYLTMPKQEYHVNKVQIKSIPSSFEKRLGSRWVYFISGDRLFFYVDGREWVLDCKYETLIQILSSDQILFNLDRQILTNGPQDLLFELFEHGLLFPLEA